jgi:hypothetical protein
VKNSLFEYVRLFQKIGLRLNVQNGNSVDFESGSKGFRAGPSKHIVFWHLYFPFYDSLDGFNVFAVYLARVQCSRICSMLINISIVNVPFPLR